MGKRYVFWRKPTGAPYTGQDDKYAPIRLLSEIGSTATIDTEGKVQWKHIRLPRILPVVLDSLVVIDAGGMELNQHDARALICQAMRELITRSGGGCPIEPGCLRRKAERQAASFFRKPLERFVLVTSLSVKPLPAGRITIDGCEIKPMRSESRYPLPDALKERLGATSGVRRPADMSRVDSEDDQLIRVRTNGRSVYDAAESALDALALLCGLWNLFATHRSFRLLSGPQRPQPMGVACVGRFHTLHTPDGEPATDLYWYEPDYAEHRQSFKGEWARIDRQRRWAARRMRCLRYSHELGRLLGRYAKAMSTPDSGSAFLQIWSLLESITNTVGARYEDTVNRATWLFRDREAARDVLKYLRWYRNQYVHAGRFDTASDVAQLVKSFVEPHFFALLNNDLHVESLEEYASFLSLPTCVETLKKRRAQAARAARIRSSWERARKP